MLTLFTWHVLVIYYARSENIAFIFPRVLNSLTLDTLKSLKLMNNLTKSYFCAIYSSIPFINFDTLITHLLLICKSLLYLMWIYMFCLAKWVRQPRKFLVMIIGVAIDLALTTITWLEDSESRVKRFGCLLTWIIIFLFFINIIIIRLS